MPSKKKPSTAGTKKPAAKPAGKAKAAPAGKNPAKGKAPAKPAAKPSPAAKPKAAKGKPEGEKSKRKGSGVRGLVAQLIADQKHTDQEIIEKVAKALPDLTININIVGACRSEMNHGTRVPEGQEPGRRYEQIVKVDGVNMPKSQRPKKAAKPRKPSRGKVNPEHDPLGKIGIAQVKRKPARKATAAA